MYKDLMLLSPLLIVSLGALLTLVLDLFVKQAWSRATIAGGVTLLALLDAVWLMQRGAFEAGLTGFNGLMYVDEFSLFFTLVILGCSLVVLLLGAGHLKSEGIETPAEFYSLFLMSTSGAIIFVSAAELITMFLGLEIMSMALYCLCGSALDRRRSSESALKYFLLGSFSSAFLLYGVALLYGLTGTTVIIKIATSLSDMGPMLYFAIGLLLVGFIFKMGAAPFHFWVPDVYQGAPTPITAYMASVIKVSAVGAALRVFWSVLGNSVILGAESDPTTGAIWFIAAITMTLGNLLALRQRSLKRMLAYSSISHAGYMLMAFLAPGDEFGGGPAILYYLVAYSAMTLGAFGVVMAVSAGREDRNGDDISSFNGLSKTNPGLSLAMAIFMLSLAGLPPGMAGLVGKFYLLSATVKADFIGLAVIAVLNSAISCAYYLRVLVAIYFTPADGDAQLNAPLLNLPTSLALSLCTVVTVFLGLFPSRFHDAVAILMAPF